MEKSKRPGERDIQAFPQDGKSWNRREKAQKMQEERRETDRQAQRGCGVSSDLSEGHRHNAGF